MLEVILLTPEKVIFKGTARRMIFPGEQGVFEVGDFHRPLFSRLLPGTLNVGHTIPTFAQAFIYIDRVEVEMRPLVLMIVAAVARMTMGTRAQSG